jgi:hypothetical protein
MMGDVMRDNVRHVGALDVVGGRRGRGRRCSGRDPNAGGDRDYGDRPAQ